MSMWPPPACTQPSAWTPQKKAEGKPICGAQEPRGWGHLTLPPPSRRQQGRVCLPRAGHPNGLMDPAGAARCWPTTSPWTPPIGPEEVQCRSPLPTRPLHEASSPSPGTAHASPLRAPSQDTPTWPEEEPAPALTCAAQRACAHRRTRAPPAAGRHWPPGPQAPSFLPGPGSHWPCPCRSTLPGAAQRRAGGPLGGAHTAPRLQEVAPGSRGG